MYFSFRANYSITLCVKIVLNYGKYIYIYSFAIFSMNRNKKTESQIYLRREKNELMAKQKVMPAAQ